MRSNILKFALTAVAFFTVVACDIGGNVSTVKKGRLQLCPDFTVEELFDALLEKPKWYHVNENGNDYVNISGVTAGSGKPENVLAQFFVKDEFFIAEAFEIDGKKTTTAAVVLLTACDFAADKAADKSHVISADPIKDSRDGKKYKTVKIGDQIWMAENINIETGNSKCYDNKPDNCKKYGRLYDWNTAMKACPNGWHLPSIKEWDKLLRYVGGITYRSKTTEEYLKAKGGWDSNSNGTDNYEFSALPGGFFSSNGYFQGVGNYGVWWFANEIAAGAADYRSIGRGYVVGLNFNKTNLYSVRCVQNTGTEQKSVKKEEKEKEETQAETSDESFDCANARSPAEKAYCTGQSLDEFLGQAEISPSFDCAKATTPAEKAICSNANLAELDNRLAEAYKKARSACKTDVKKEQREWIKKMSSCTSNVQCLENSYKSRIQELENCR